MVPRHSPGKSYSIPQTVLCDKESGLLGQEEPTLALREGEKTLPKPT